MNVAYLGPMKDYSGYGEANRHFIAALDTAGVTVIPQPVAYSHDSSDFGPLGARIDALMGNQADYQVQILHTTPNVFKRHMEPGKYHIAHFFWETTRVPAEFVKGLQLMDEIWTGCEANKQAILDSGIDKPVFVFPQPVEEHPQVEPYVIDGFNGYLFYSIFEWTERKNPEALLQAYWRAFQNGENVGLLIKTYFNDFQMEHKRMIRQAITKLKAETGLKQFPPLFLYLDLMDRQQIMRIHETGDYYVSATRGEGWGVPQVQAAMAAKPMISTAWSGCHEYFSNESAMLLPYSMVPVENMERSADWYTHDQQWAEVNAEDLAAAFHHAYAAPADMKQRGQEAQRVASHLFGFEHVGNMMRDRLKQIQEELNG